MKRYFSSFRKMTGKRPKFLELGSGTGFVMKALSQENLFELTGSELYLQALKYAKQKLPNVEFIQFDAAATEALPRKFNLIGAFDVIEHIEDDRQVLKNMAGMLEDNGMLFLSVPQYMFLWSQLDEIVKHKRRYSKKELLSKLNEAGFSPVFVSSFVFALFPAVCLVRLRDKSQESNKSNVKEDFEKRVSFPNFLNVILDNIMKIDEFLISMGMSLPFGASLVVLATKKQ